MTETLPVTISPEARALAAELGFQTQLDQMIERAIQTFSNLLGVDVVRYDLVDEPEAPRIVVSVSKAGQRDPDDRRVRRREWVEWTWTMYPPQVYATIVIDIIYPEERHARSDVS